MGGSFLKLMKLLFEDCEQESAEDRTLPNNSFLIEYKIDGVSHYDIAIASKQVEIFDLIIVLIFFYLVLVLHTLYLIRLKR